MTTENQNLPTPIWSGSFRLLGIEIKCHTLSDGHRIIEAESFHAFLDLLNGCGVDVEHQAADDEGVAAFARWRAGGNVEGARP